MYFAIVLAFVGGALGAWLGWRRGTRRMHRVSYFQPDHHGMGRHEARRRQRRNRLVLALSWLVAGAFVAFTAGLAMGWR